MASRTRWDLRSPTNCSRGRCIFKCSLDGCPCGGAGSHVSVEPGRPSSTANSWQMLLYTKTWLNCTSLRRCPSRPNVNWGVSSDRSQHSRARGAGAAHSPEDCPTRIVVGSADPANLLDRSVHIPHCRYPNWPKMVFLNILVGHPPDLSPSFRRLDEINHRFGQRRQD